MMTRGLAMLIVVASAASARAEPPRPLPHPHAGLGGGVAIGRAQEGGREAGWIVRLDGEALPVLARPEQAGGVFGFTIAGQVWQSGGDWGVGLPATIVVGARFRHVRAVVHLGVEVFSIEETDDDTGVGLYQPLAGAAVMMEVAGWHLGVDGRVTRRWQIGAPDHTQWQAALMVGRTWEAAQREPIR